MSIKCLLHGHDTVDIGTDWEADWHDEYMSTNTGGPVMYYQVIVYQCTRCKHRHTVPTGVKQLR